MQVRLRSFGLAWSFEVTGSPVAKPAHLAQAQGFYLEIGGLSLMALRSNHSVP